MRSDSLTRFWPMNSDRRWGRSESSTTLSSGMISGVVISARDITSQFKVYRSSLLGCANADRDRESLAQGAALTGLRRKVKMSKERSDPFDFGTIIAFVAPGFIALVGVSFHVDAVK